VKGVPAMKNERFVAFGGKFEGGDQRGLLLIGGNPALGIIKTDFTNRDKLRMAAQRPKLVPNLIARLIGVVGVEPGRPPNFSAIIFREDAGFFPLIRPVGDFDDRF